VSAFKGRNADLGALGEFLKMVERGRVRPGDFLVVENLDRLTRDDLQPALRLILGILAAGVRIVQLTPVEVTYDSKSDTVALIIMIVELSRANSESKVKSDRVGKARAQERKAARDNGDLMSRMIPAWCEVKDGKAVLVANRAAAVKRIFTLAAAGQGIRGIIQTLTAEQVKPIGRSGKWTRAYISIILKDRRATGELQPKSHGKADGEPIANYYPQVVTETEWYAARESTGSRQTRKTKGGYGAVNVFKGLLKHARDDDPYQMTTYTSRSGRRVLRKFQVLVNSKGTDHSGRGYSLPYDVVETAVLSWLSELDPSEILPGNGAADEVLSLAAEEAKLLASIETLNADMDEHGESPALMKRVREKETRLIEVRERHAVAKQRVSNPLSAMWGDAKVLVKALRSAQDQDKRDLRLRLRGALRRLIETMHILIVPRGQLRLASIQIDFKSDHPFRVEYNGQLIERLPFRSYQLLYQPASGPRGSGAWACSIGHPAALEAGVPFGLNRDLSNPDDVLAEEGYLSAVDTELLKRLWDRLPGY
jgi:DNA invertase Pin-like site-specific DNA recombinase